jgi:hypothetical protein
VAGAAVVAPHDGVPVLARPARYGVLDLLRALHGRPVLLLAPARDPEADPGAVAAAARAAGVAHRVIDDHHRLSGQSRALIRAWMRHPVG